ncbi:MAG TPA: SRPBCC domain-containing protein [Pyrinomonadaceae bacterium]|nr:SRPBCC domain-containing protein [Pyrinomonadaceae bacterium]
MSKRVDTASKVIRASTAQIYLAFATSSAMETWLPPEGMTARLFAFEFREGGGYSMQLTYEEARHMPGKTSANADEVEVRFIRLVPNDRIEQAVIFKSNDSAFEGEMKMTWILEPRRDGTLVTVRCENVPSGISPEDHQAGLKSSLHNLAQFAEGTP